jgi:hypothetical protein
LNLLGRVSDFRRFVGTGIFGLFGFLLRIADTGAHICRDMVYRSISEPDYVQIA